MSLPPELKCTRGYVPTGPNTRTNSQDGFDAAAAVQTAAQTDVASALNRKQKFGRVFGAVLTVIGGIGLAAASLKDTIQPATASNPESTMLPQSDPPGIPILATKEIWNPSGAVMRYGGCNATIIGPNIAMTAAHCVIKAHPGDMLVTGSLDIGDPNTQYRAVVATNFDPDSYTDACKARLATNIRGCKDVGIIGFVPAAPDYMIQPPTVTTTQIAVGEMYTRTSFTPNRLGRYTVPDTTRFIFRGRLANLDAFAAYPSIGLPGIKGQSGSIVVNKDGEPVGLLSELLDSFGLPGYVGFMDLTKPEVVKSIQASRQIVEKAIPVVSEKISLQTNIKVSDAIDASGRFTASVKSEFSTGIRNDWERTTYLSDEDSSKRDCVQVDVAGTLAANKGMKIESVNRRVTKITRGPPEAAVSVVYDASECPPDTEVTVRLGGVDVNWRGLNTYFPAAAMDTPDGMAVDYGSTNKGGSIRTPFIQKPEVKEEK